MEIYVYCANVCAMLHIQQNNRNTAARYICLSVCLSIYLSLFNQPAQVIQLRMGSLTPMLKFQPEIFHAPQHLMSK